MSIGIRCLLAGNEREATQLATQLDELNRQRRQIEGDMQAQAQAAVKHLAAWVEGDKHAGLDAVRCRLAPGRGGIGGEPHQGSLGRPVVAFAPAGEGD